MADCSGKRLRCKSCRAVLIAAQEIPAELRLYCPGVSRTRFVIAFLIIMLGRLVLTIEGRGTFLMDLSRC